MSTELITKEEAREQFNRITQQLNIRHTFSFDEVYDMLMDRRLAKQQQVEFRRMITEFEKKLEVVPGVEKGNCHPLTHTFADGMYVRQLTVPSQTLTVTKIHAKDNFFFLLKGTMSMLTENGVNTITAPCWGVTRAGTKRIIWHHDEVLFCTVHRTDEVDVDNAENDIIAKDFKQIDDKIEQQKIDDFIKLMKEGDICQ